MKKNWYIIYTKAQFEKRVASFCSKKKLEYYLPVINSYAAGRSKKGKQTSRPLFQSFVFIYTSAEELNEIRKADGVLSILHLKDKPAVINSDEIEAIKGFIEVYPNIKVENSLVNSGEPAKKLSNAFEPITGKIYSVSYKEVRLNLPSMGFTLVANPGADEFNTHAEEISIKTASHAHAS
ncbi:MAG: transcription termination/antitermination NusG family protein [Ferruginibacter sp.]